MPNWQETDQSQLGESRLDGSQLTEAQLLIAAQDGDAEAFGQLYELYAPVIFRFLYAHLSERLDAEDLTEEVFLRVWRSLAQYQDQGLPFGAYLFRVARNALIDHYRRVRRTEPNLPLEEDILSDGHADPADAALAGMESKEIRKMLEELREDYRTVLVLRFISDLSPDETAEAMGKSSGAVRVLQHRALAALRKLMGS